MNTYKPLPSNAAKDPALFLDTCAPTDVLLANATRRVEAVRDLASALTLMSDKTQGIQAKDLSAFALVTEFLTSDAVALLEASESALMRSKRASA